MFSKKKKTPTNTLRVRTSQPTPRGPVFSYHANRSVRIGGSTRTSEEHQQSLRRGPRFPWLKQVPTLAVLLMCLLLLVFCLQLNGHAKVVAVGGSDSQVFLREQKVYEEAARTLFQTFLNSNKLTVDATKVSADLKHQFPELKAVSVALPIVGNRPVVYIQPASPRLVLLGKDGMFVLDADGRALMPAAQVLGLDKLEIPVVNDQSDLSVEAGRIVLPRSTVAFIDEVVGQHKAKGLKITSMTLPPGTNELHVRPDGVGYIVKYNIHGNAREEAGAFLAVKARLEAEKKTPREYIDVRVENRAYYK
jgi:hypothetical protein